MFKIQAKVKCLSDPKVVIAFLEKHTTKNTRGLALHSHEHGTREYPHSIFQIGYYCPLTLFNEGVYDPESVDKLREERALFRVTQLRPLLKISQKDRIQTSYNISANLQLKWDNAQPSCNNFTTTDSIQINCISDKIIIHSQYKLNAPNELANIEITGTVNEDPIPTKNISLS